MRHINVLEQKILDALAERDGAVSGIREFTRILGVNYHSVRSAILRLQTSGHLSIEGRLIKLNVEDRLIAAWNAADEESRRAFLDLLNESSCEG